jgi:tripartite-type tricarboxylate transporter receptor subunit TctC
MIMRIGLWSRTFALTILLGVVGEARAQAPAMNYPDRPVRIIVDSAPGSANDVLARLTAEGLGKIWNQQVIIVNQPGAGGGIATRAASAAPNDGYTLYLAGASTFLALAGAPGVAANLPIEMPRDFTPVGMVALQPMFIGASHALNLKSIQDLIDVAKKKPNEIGYAATGRGRITHLTMELLQKMANVKMQLVAYTGGPSQAMTDIIAGRVGVVLDGYASLAGALQGKSIQSLAVTSAQRLREFPDLPTVAETLPGFQSGGWNVLIAPLGTPAPLLQKASADLRKALDDAELRSRLAAIGAFVRHMSPDELNAFSQDEQRTWRPILEQLAKETP